MGTSVRGHHGRPARTRMAAPWEPASVAPVLATAQPPSVAAGSARAPAWRSPTALGVWLPALRPAFTCEL